MKKQTTKATNKELAKKKAAKKLDNEHLDDMRGGAGYYSFWLSPTSKKKRRKPRFKINTKRGKFQGHRWVRFTSGANGAVSYDNVLCYVTLDKGVFYVRKVCGTWDSTGHGITAWELKTHQERAAEADKHPSLVVNEPEQTFEYIGTCEKDLPDDRFF